MGDGRGRESAVVALEGHIIDSLTLPRVLDLILDAGAGYELLEVRIGRTPLDPSLARLRVDADDPTELDRLLEELRAHGANAVDEHDCEVRPAPANGVLPEGFYSSTNLPTEVRVGGRWRRVAPAEMDCAVVLSDPGTGTGAATRPMADVAAGEPVVVGTMGVRVSVPPKPSEDAGFAFMTSDISSEKPKAQLLDRLASRVRACRERGERVLAVPGPAVVHTGASPALAALVRGGWVDVLFSGNGFAAHDIESALYGTSLGVPLAVVDAGLDRHANHLRAINRARRWGSIAAGVERGELNSGTLYECVRRGVPFVLGGSLRDDGPLPDVVTDVLEAQRRMRALLPGVGVALMLGSTLHAVATGNLLSAEVETFCVDINPAVVTKLTDRGTHQAVGIVTDVGLLLRELGELLCP